LWPKSEIGKGVQPKISDNNLEMPTIFALYGNFIVIIITKIGLVREQRQGPVRSLRQLLKTGEGYLFRSLSK
jgi:hypothetical protein